MNMPSKDLFATACGLRGPLELEVSTEKQEKEERCYAFSEPWVVLGRDVHMGLRLDDAAVSRRHAYLQVLGDRLLAIDLNSRTGLTLAGTAAASGWIADGRSLSVGPFQIKRVTHPGLEPASDSAVMVDPLSDDPSANISEAIASFDIWLDSQRVARWRMNRQLALVGSSARCRVRLRDQTVSRFHCSLVGTPKGVWVADLCSRSGIRLRDEAVRFAPLEEGDALQVGPYTLRIAYRRSGAVSTFPAVEEGSAASATMQPAASTPQRSTSPAGPLVVLGSNNHAPGVPPSLVGEANTLMPLVQQFNSLQQHMFDQFQQTLVMLVRLMSSMHQEQVALIREELGQFQKVTEELHRLQEQAQQGRGVYSAGAAAQHAPYPPMEPRSAVPSSTVVPPVSKSAGAPTEQGSAADPGIHDWLTHRIGELQKDRQSRWQHILGFLRGS